MGSEAVHQLVHQDVREERVERHVLLLCGRQRDLGDREQDHLELRVLHVLQHHALGALLAHDALVVGQVVGGRLHTAVAIARREHDVDDANWRQGAEFAVPVLRVDRQRVFELLQMRREGLQLLRLGIVSNGDECFERRLGVEPFVFVHLVRTDGRLDRGIELHPGDVARVVVVRHERVGARGQELLERRLGRGVRGLPKVRRRRLPAPPGIRSNTEPP